MKRLLKVPGDGEAGPSAPKKRKMKRGRVPCPRDPSHSVAEKKLEAHLAKCGADGHLTGARVTAAVHTASEVAWQQLAAEERRSLAEGGDGLLAMLHAGCTSNTVRKTGVRPVTEVARQYERARDVPPAVAAELELRVAAACVAASAALQGCAAPEVEDTSLHCMQAWWKRQPEQQADGGAARSEDDPEKKSTARQKSDDQLVAMLGVMKARNMLHTHGETCFVEFGAGKGTLSLALQQACGAASSHLLLDRCSFKHRARLDRSGGMEHAAWIAQQELLPASSGEVLLPEVHRVTASIESLLLSRFLALRPLAVKDIGNGTVSVTRGSTRSKQMVGVGKHVCGLALDHSLRALERTKDSVAGIAMATCCHYLCSAETSVATPFLVDGLGLTVGDVDLMALFSHWATLRNAGRADDRRQLFGLQCKYLFDVGRVMFVRQQLGFQAATLLRYCSSAVTVENALIWASRLPTAGA